MQPDLFQVRRSGPDRNANVVMTVNDGGTVTCNRGKPRALPGRELLAARDMARRLDQQASLSIELPPGHGSLLRYVVRTQAGRVAFSDTSAGKPPVFDQLQAFTKDVTEQVCGLRR
jgi:hypothetical protein